jgi:DNA mismatch endonuclease (patch repair protein)
MAVRRLLHRAGFRYRVDSRPVPTINRRADVVFASSKVAVFIDGCFWHGCPDHSTWPKKNGEFWRAKILRTIERDRETTEVLTEAGWIVVRAWEHENPGDVAERVADVVCRDQSRPTPTFAPTISATTSPN